MNITAYDLKKIELKKHYFKKSENQKIIEAFIESGQDCVKVEGWTQKTAWCCAGCLNKSIKRYKITEARALSRNGEVFLVKTSVIK